MNKGADLNIKNNEGKIPLMNRSLLMYRNALIKELSNTFKYTDYDQFKEQVVESIDNKQVVVVEYSHLKALRHFLYQDKNESNSENISISKEVNEFLKSFEFRERLVADYMNVLDSQRELLEIRIIQLTQTFPQFSMSNDDCNLNANANLMNFKLRQLTSEDGGQILIDLVQLQNIVEHQLNIFSIMVEGINKYIQTIKNKIKIASEVLHLLETS